jgi:predicted lipoprotein with Yx(FWY)xxD motif
MKKTPLLLIALLLAVAPAVTFAMHHEVKIADKPGLGKYLTDAEGKTLYWFKKDAAGKSECSGGCLEKWPAFYRETLAPPAGTVKEDFATITRSDGAKQTTFRGYPLYYWAGDAKAGDTNGQGMMDVWFVVDPGNFPPK